jgi:purine-binding chemotaxis protein CheW
MLQMEKRMYSLQTFRVGSREFAVQESEIATVAGWRQPTPLPHAPASVLGIVSLQGRMLTVLDLAKISEGDNASGNGTRQQLIALRGDEQLALAVDEVAEKIEISEFNFESKTTNPAVTLGVLSHQGRQIEVVNVKGLFPSAIQGRERRQRRF